jgi:Tfp pilus assembly protein PilE
VSLFPIPSLWVIGAVAAAIAIPSAGFEVQSVRLKHAKADLVEARGQAKAFKDAMKVSEANRDAERTDAVGALTSAGLECQARVDRAMKTGAKIRTIVEKPRERPIDQKSGCPANAVISGSELRDALGLHP